MLEAERVDDRELAAVRVLELVDHHQVETAGPRGADPLVLEQPAGDQLEVVEFEQRPFALEPGERGVEPSDQAPSKTSTAGAASRDGASSRPGGGVGSSERRAALRSRS